MRKHKCELCKRGFGQVEELMQHQQVVHGKDSMYECTRCNLTFTGGQELRNHARLYHSYKK